MRRPSSKTDLFSFAIFLVALLPLAARGNDYLNAAAKLGIEEVGPLQVVVDDLARKIPRRVTEIAYLLDRGFEPGQFTYTPGLKSEITLLARSAREVTVSYKLPVGSYDIVSLIRHENVYGFDGFTRGFWVTSRRQNEQPRLGTLADQPPQLSHQGILRVAAVKNRIEDKTVLRKRVIYSTALGSDLVLNVQEGTIYSAQELRQELDAMSWLSDANYVGKQLADEEIHTLFSGIQHPDREPLYTKVVRDLMITNDEFFPLVVWPTASWFLPIKANYQNSDLPVWKTVTFSVD